MRSARAVAVAVMVVAPLLGGCGIQETDVIEAGGPASFQAFFNRDSDMMLFFRSPDGGLSPVIRTPESTTGPIPTEKVVLALLAGPGAEDRAAGLSTALPTALSTTRSGATIEVDRSPGDRVTTRLPLAVKSLDSTAVRQLTCTIAYSQDADAQVVVELRGHDGAARSGRCGLAAGGTGG